MKGRSSSGGFMSSAQREIPKSCAPLLRLLRRPAEDVEELLGDAVTKSLPRIAAGIFDGDADALFAAISDRSIEEYARAGLLHAATFLAWEGRIERERMRRFLEDFYQERPAEDGKYVWVAWLDAIGLLGLRDLAPLVTRAFEEGRILEDISPLTTSNRSWLKRRAPRTMSRVWGKSGWDTSTTWWRRLHGPAAPPISMAKTIRTHSGRRKTRPPSTPGAISAATIPARAAAAKSSRSAVGPIDRSGQSGSAHRRCTPKSRSSSPRKRGSNRVAQHPQGSLLRRGCDDFDDSMAVLEAS